MTDIFKDIEPMVYKSQINVPYSWWAGKTASKFFTELKENKKIMGTKCDKCSKVYVPPRKICPFCFKENQAWVELSDEGILLSYTIVRKQLASLPKKVPVIYGLIKLDGADTGLLHFIDEVLPKDIKIGMRLKACFLEERAGKIQDIGYFKPIN
ncbi:MAG: Zn-ribbon domain-containing OB-fold protein [Desulfobacterales bacterium]|nr:Zn-ribbon domain-containing OB-fold protein [Desulfobacterales bacterium]MBF0396075.1 Zn-ribbon domain-containing OB-fold protein [Desulfobacterales bacterium]